MAAGNAVQLDTTGPTTPELQVIDIDGDDFALDGAHVELRWSTPVDGDLAGFELQRLVRNTDDDFQHHASFTAADSTHTDDVTATTGELHRYRVRAYDDLSNSSAWSAVAEARPFEGIAGGHWVRDADTLVVHYPPEPGTFSIDAYFTYEDLAGSVYEQGLLADRTFWRRTGVAGLSYNETLWLKQANQDGTAVYQTELLLTPLNVRETLDTGLPAAATPALAVDSGGGLHVAYVLDGEVMYAHQPRGGVWTQELANNDAHAIDAYTALALDGADRPHISFVSGAKRLRYASKPAGAWVMEAVSNFDSGYGRSSLVIDDAGKVHMSAYRGSSYGYLQYVTNTSGAWVRTVIDDGGDGQGGITVGEYNRIGMDSAGQLHVAYSTSSALQYAVRVASNTAGWTTTEARTFVSPQRLDGGVAMVIDSSDHRHLVYKQYVGSRLEYATDQSGSWVVSDISTGAEPDPALALDENDVVHVAYGDSNTGELLYRTNASGSWEPLALETGGHAAAVAVDQSARLHVVHVDDTDLRHVSYAPAGRLPWVTETISSAARTYTAIGSDSRNRLHVASNEYGGGYSYRLLYSTNTSGSWVTTVVDDPGTGAGFHTSLAIDDADHVHLAYIDKVDPSPTVEWRLKYATNASGAWVVENPAAIANAGSISTDTPTITGIAVDALGRVHIAYQNNSQHVRYLTNASGAWVDSFVDDGAAQGASSVGSSVAIRIDASNYPHIAYELRKAGERALKVAQWNGVSWAFSLIENAGAFIGTGVSMALDATGHAHIVVRGKDDTGNNALFYVTNASGAWEIVLLSSDVTGYAYQALVLDRAGNVHIAYETKSALRYTTNAFGSFVTSSFNTTRQGNRSYLALAIDGWDRVHVSYYDDVDLDLVYTGGFFTGELEARALTQTTPF